MPTPGPGGRVMAAFALHATTVGSLFARLPEVQKALGLSEATFGIVLMGMPVGVVLGSILISPLVGTWGPKRLLLLGIPLIGAVLPLTTLASSAATLCAALFVFGLAFATSNVAINVEADRVEAAEGRRILSRCHGWWALGFLATALVSAGLIRIGVPPAGQFVGLFLLLLLLVPAALIPLPVSTPRAGAAGTGRRFALPGRSTLLIGGFALAGIVLEGTTRSWAVIYVRDAFGAADWLAALALPAIVVTQTAGRFAGDGLVERFGATTAARMIALALLAGVVAITLAPVVAAVLAGFMLVGLGVSTVLPQSFSAAARWGDRPAAEGMAAFATLSTLIGFLGPPVFGMAAEWLGLRAAFALFIPLPLISLIFAGYLAARDDAEAAAQTAD
jgi:MFS family permease